MHGLPVGAFVEGELHLSWMQMFPSSFMPFIFIVYLFFFKKIIRGHFLGMVTQVDIGGHPPFPTGSKQFSDNFGNLLFLAVLTSGAILRA
jgi:hypothetical protein